MASDLTPLNNTLQKALEEGFVQAGGVFFERLLLKKLEEQNVTLSLEKLSELRQHILSGRKGNFVLDERKVDRTIKLSFTKQDIDELLEQVESFSEKQTAELIPAIAAESAESILKRLKGSWAAEGSLQAQDLVGFRERMEVRWGKPLGQLRMLLTMIREWSQTASARQALASKKKNDLNGILIRLLVRGCQTSDEIICLLENGFPDGAMARWRTLHEIAVVASVLRQHGKEIAERYLDHQYVESKRAMDKYVETSQLLGYKQLSKRSKEQIQRDYDRVLLKYGDNFKSDYGWAAHHLKNKRPTFAALEKEAGKAEMRSYYQMGNDNIHAGIKSMYVRLGLIGNYDALLSGRSNAGLTDPGQNTAHSLTQLTIIVCLVEPVMDDLVVGHMIQSLRDEIPLSFSRVDSAIKREEKEKDESSKRRKRKASA